MIHPSPLPFLPEPMHKLQARFPGGLLKRWDFRTRPVGAANLPPFDRPQLHRAHVFDLSRGVRFIIARVYHAAVPWYDPKPRDWIHVAFTVATRSLPPDDLQLLSEIHLDRITRGQLVVAVERFIPHGGPADLYFLPPSTTPPGCLLDDFPGKRIRVCL